MSSDGGYVEFFYLYRSLSIFVDAPKKARPALWHNFADLYHVQFWVTRSTRL